MTTEYRPVRFKCSGTLKGLTEDYWNEAYQARDSGRKIAWCSGLVPSDILAAMDFFNIFAMNNSATCGAQRLSVDLCEIAEAEGYSPDLCSYARTDIGGALQGEETRNPLKPPKPDMLLVGNGQCHSITKWFEALGHIFNVPVILIDAPFMHDDANEDTYLNAKNYLIEQFQELISFLEGFTGRRFNHDRLQECVEHSGNLFRAWKEALKLRQHIPTPMSAFDIFTQLFPILGFRAIPEGAAYYRELQTELAERIAQEMWAVPNERFRLHVDGIPMWYNLRGIPTKLASYGAVAVTHFYFCAFDYWFLDSSQPLDSTADVLLRCYVNRGIKQRIDIISRLIEDYHLDGMIVQVSRTCKGVTATSYELARGVEEKTGVPSLIYESDMCDSRLFAEAQVDVRLEAFMEMLASKTPTR